MITPRTPSLSPAEEARLVAAAQDGSAPAMDRLIRAHYRQMYQMALKMTHDPVRAQDVTQDACVQALRKIGQFRSEARFGSWLGRIVLNSALLRHRREWRRVPSGDTPDKNAPATEPGPDRHAGDRELLERVSDALEATRAGDRALFWDRFLGGMSLEELAAQTGQSIPAIKSRFHRARHRLRAMAVSEGWSVLHAA